MAKRATNFNIMPLIFLIFALTFGGAAIGMFFTFIMPDITMSKIAKTGTERVAVVNGCYSNTTVNGQPYYYILYTWQDDDGNFHDGKSNSAYTRSEADQFETAGTVTIRTRGTKSTIVPFKKSGFSGMAPFLLIPFLLVGVGMGTAFGVSMHKGIRRRATALLGTAGTGHFIESGIGYRMNGIPVYYIRFAFENGSGQVIEIKSPSNYSEHAAKQLENEKEFPIKQRGKYAVIMKSYTPELPAARQSKKTDSHDFVECEYCGLKNQPKTKRCSACGGKLK